MFFELKKILSSLLSPSFLILLGLGAGAAGLLFSRRRRVTGSLLLFSFTLGVLCFFPWMPDALTDYLEKQYEPFSCVSEGVGPGWMVVLGQGVKEGALPETSRINGTMYVRLMEAVRISREAENVKIIVSLSGRESAGCKTGWWSFFCRTVQLSAEGSVVLTEPLDTEAELRQVLEIVGSEPFILVTSASHMPRAMQIARSLGGTALAAPCGFRGSFSGPLYRRILPSSRNLRRTERAWHELKGLWWWRVKGFAARCGGVRNGVIQ